MANRAAGEHGDVGRAAADIHQANAEVFFVVVQHRFGGCKRLQNHIAHFEAAATHAFGEVLDG